MRVIRIMTCHNLGTVFRQCVETITGPSSKNANQSRVRECREAPLEGNRQTVGKHRDRGAALALLLFHRALQRVLVTPGKIHDLCDFGFCNLE